MEHHIFEQPGRPVTIEAHFESEPRLEEKSPACPVCGTAVDLDNLEHSIRSKPLRATEGEPPSFLLLSSMPCFKEGCPVYLKLEVKISEEEFSKWRESPDCRLDHTYYRDGRPVTMEAKADENLTAPPPHICPVCLTSLSLAAVVPFSKILISGAPLPSSTAPPQHRATAYASCPHCGARLICYCFISAEEIIALRTGHETSGDLT